MNREVHVGINPRVYLAEMPNRGTSGIVVAQTLPFGAIAG